MKIKTLLIFIIFYGASAFGNEISDSLDKYNLDDQSDMTHFIGVRAVGGKPFGGSLSYDYKLTSRWLLGASAFVGSTGTSSSGGDLDAGEYYVEDSSFKKTQVKLNNTIYFRRNGVSRWGFLTKIGVGYSWNKMSSGFVRYDRDPAFFRFFGEKRARESDTVSDAWEEVVGNVGLFYQFAWNMSGSVGHILQVGANYFVESQGTRALQYTKSNGEIKTYESEFNPVALELSYMFAF